MADEINRTPPHQHHMEAMQEKSVTIAGQYFQLDAPFYLATQNPIEQEGTYPLPEAQLDRFMFISFRVSGFQEEVQVVKNTTANEMAEKKQCYLLKIF